MAELNIKSDNLGEYNIQYAYEKGPFCNQMILFGANGLQLISPAILGAMRARKGNEKPFCSYSRTDMDIIGRPETGDYVLIDGKVLGNIYTSGLVTAHETCENFMIPKKNRDLIYDMIDTSLKNGSALRIGAGSKTIPTSDFGKTEITDFMFSDVDLGIRSQDYGDALNNFIDSITLFFDCKDYIKNQAGFYLTKVRLFGRGNNYDVNGYGSASLTDDCGALGVNLISIKGGRKKSSYTEQDLHNVKKVTGSVKEGREGVAMLEGVMEFLEKL